MQKDKAFINRLIAALIVAAMAVVVYANSTKNGFVGDDHYLVENNPLLEKGPSLADIFTKPWGAYGSEFERGMNQGYYRPLAVAVFSLEYAVWGKNAFFYHLVSLLVHAAVCVVFMFFCLRFMNLAAAAAAACLFAIHAVHTEAVNAIFYRTTLLAALFCMAAMYVHAEEGADARRRMLNHVKTGILYALALMSKETALMLPLYMALYDMLIRTRRLPELDRKRYAVLLIMAVAYVLARYAIVSRGAISYFEGASSLSVFLTMTGVFLMYIRLLLWPHPLCAFYEWTIIPPVEKIMSAIALGGLSAVILYLSATIWITVRARRLPQTPGNDLPATRIISFGMWLLPVSLLPVMHFIPILNVAAERFLYFGSAGICILFGLATEKTLRMHSSVSRIPALIVICVYLMALSLITVHRNNAWHSDLALYQATIYTHPESVSSRLGLARILYEQGRKAEALKQIETVEKLAPGIDAVKKFREKIQREMER